MKLLRLFVLILSALVVGFAGAGTITVTSPAKGSAVNPTPIKGTTSVNFNITGGVTQVTVTVRIFRLDNNTLYSALEPVKVTPNTDGKVSGSATLKFTKGIDPEIGYRVEIRASEESTPGNVYNADQDIFVKPDLTAPKIIRFTPVSGAFVKGVVTITVQIQEDNLKDWRVQVDNGDLPNGTGTTVNSQGRFTVQWDTSGVVLDGAKTITVRVKDTADNETTQNINVTIDRIKPVITIRTPQNNTAFTSGSIVNVAVDIRDASTTSVPVTGVDVVVRTTTGTFVLRVPRISYTQVDGNTMRWTGRIRWVSGQLPRTFRIHVSAIDKAQNVANPQVVTVTIG